jgi:hypothetical protein
MDLLWSPASDTFGHEVDYNLYYFSDAGTSWNPIAEALQVTQYQWNTSLLQHNLTYNLRVESHCAVDMRAAAITQQEFMVRDHTLTSPTILSPNGGEVLTPGAACVWTQSIDSWEHDVSYDVYISPDNGGNWILLATATEELSMGLGYESMPDGNQYLLRVVAECEDGLSVEDLSDAVFTIKSSFFLEYFSIGMVLIATTSIVIVFLYKRRMK